MSNLKNQLEKKANGSSAEQASGGFNEILTKQLTNQFKAIQSLVPKHVTPERLCRIGLNAVSRNPKLMDCSPPTIVGAIVNCASLGLEPNLLGHAYIVPFWNGKTKQMEAQFQIGYKGAVDLVRRTGAVSTITARAVYEGDDFEYAYGLDDKLHHVPCGEADGSKITHFYALYKLKDGGSDFIVMTREQMDKHRDKFTKSQKDGIIFGPWKDHYESMGLKTVLLRLIKFMPISIEQQEAQAIMEGLQRDNATMQIKNPSENYSFGDSFIDADYVVNEEEAKTEKNLEDEDLKGTPFEEGK